MLVTKGMARQHEALSDRADTLFFSEILGVLGEFRKKINLFWGKSKSKDRNEFKSLDFRKKSCPLWLNIQNDSNGYFPQ